MSGLERVEAGLGELRGLGDCQGEGGGGEATLGTGLLGMGEGSCQRCTSRVSEIKRGEGRNVHGIGSFGHWER